MINEIEIKEYEGNSRIIKFNVSSIERKSPGYFPLLDRVADPRNVMDAFIFLENSQKNIVFPHIPGFIMEADSVFSMLDSDLNLSRQSRLWARKRGEGFKEFFEFMEQYRMEFMIDPNLDRINNGAYRDGFLSLGNFLTKEAKEALMKKEKLPYSLLKEPELIRKSLSFQITFKTTALIAPYVPIDLRNVDETLNNAIEMYESADEIVRKIWKRENPPIPVLCIRKNILDARPDENGTRNAWNKIIDRFSEINAPILIMKISDFNTKSKDEKYENLEKFFQEVKRKIEKPILFLSMNEFAYVLFRDGLDFYSNAMGKGLPKSMAGANIAEDQRDSDGLYYVPREMRNVRKMDLKKLPCHCPFCTPFLRQNAKDIDTQTWRSLRIKHYAWCKNTEIEHLQQELEKNSLRAALLSMFADSKEWKNFTNFI